MTRRWRAAVAGLLLAVSLAPDRVAAQADGVPVALPSLDTTWGRPLELTGRWFAAPVASSDPSARPAVLLLHGCGGMWGRDGRPSSQIRIYATLLNRQGWHALALDSLTPRGERELCTQRMAGRKVTQVERRLDVLGALRWLAARPDVDPARLALLGWSHGGSAVLAASNLNHPAVAQETILPPRLSVAFYPGCAAELRRGYRPQADTLLLVGLADDWTAAAPCQVMAREDEPPIRVLAYEGAHHGFDSLVPVRYRPEVPGGVNPGQGVHVGGQPEAREASRQALLEALRRAFGN